MVVQQAGDLLCPSTLLLGLSRNTKSQLRLARGFVPLVRSTQRGASVSQGLNINQLKWHAVFIHVLFVLMRVVPAISRCDGFSSRVITRSMSSNSYGLDVNNLLFKYAKIPPLTLPCLAMRDALWTCCVYRRNSLPGRISSTSSHNSG